MKATLLKTILILTAIVFCNSSAWAVFGEVDTDLDMRGSLVSIVLKKGTCSGVLVAKNLVLSAAHCVDMLGAPERALILSKDKAQVHCNKSKIIDFEYTPNAKPILPKKVHAPDLVIFRLESDLCSAKVATITETPLKQGDVLELSGFGGGSGIWYKSKQISLEVIASEGVKDLNTTDDPYFTDLLDLSAGYYLYATPVIQNTTSCNGDSGGPLFVNNNGQMELHGIQGAVFPNKNFGAERCSRGYLHLFTPIVPHYNWISSKIKLWSNN